VGYWRDFFQNHGSGLLKKYGLQYANTLPIHSENTDKVFSELKQIVEDSLDNKAGRASDKARFAEDKAAEANDVETILRYKEEARIWKDVALEYASSKNELDHKFVEHKNKTKNNVVDDISKIGLRSDFQGGDTKVKIFTVDND